jgi:hypothetical protein
MPTRLERLAEQERKDAERLAKTQNRRAQAEAKDLLKAQEANDKKRYRLGAKLDEKGFFALEEATLEQLMDLLVPLITLDDPVETLNRLIGVPLELAAKGVEVLPSNGMVHNSGADRGQDPSDDARPRVSKRHDKVGADSVPESE